MLAESDVAMLLPNGGGAPYDWAEGEALFGSTFAGNIYVPPPSGIVDFGKTPPTPPPANAPIRFLEKPIPFSEGILSPNTDEIHGNGFVLPNINATWRRLPADLSVTSYDEYRRIRIRFGVLATPKFVETRLFPMLNTSLLDAENIDIFIRKTPVSHAVAKYIKEGIATFHPFAKSIRVVELYGPQNDKFSRSPTRNGWMNLNILRFWHSEAMQEAAGTVHLEGEGEAEEGEKEEGRRGGLDSNSDTNGQKDIGKDGVEEEEDKKKKKSEEAERRRLRRLRPQWYSMIDDDGYVFVESAKAFLLDVERGDTKHSGQHKKAWFFSMLEARANARRNEVIAFREASAVAADSTSDSVKGKGAALLYPPHLTPEHRAATEGTEHTYGHHTGPILAGVSFFYQVGNATGRFVNGGPGLYFNRAALEVTGPSIDQCEGKFTIDGAGDMALSRCMTEAGVVIHGRRSICNEPFEVCLGWRHHEQSSFPVGAHRIVANGPKGLHKARAIYEARRERGELVHWNDILRHFPKEAERPIEIPKDFRFPTHPSRR